MEAAKLGDKVRVHYRGTLDDGSMFDSSDGGEPIEFTIGEGRVIDGFEQAVIGMKPGDRKQQRIEAGDAYGEHDPDLLFEVDKSALPPGTEVARGDFLQLSLPDGEMAPVRVADVTDDGLMLDANHPLAGKTLTFDLHLVSIG